MKDLAQLNWDDYYAALNDKGFARIPGVLSTAECLDLQSFYTKETLFRSIINMQRYRFGKGEYKYFNYPLPPIIQTMREKFYQPLARIANAWMRQLNIDVVYPGEHQALFRNAIPKTKRGRHRLFLNMKPVDTILYTRIFMVKFIFPSRLLLY